MTPVRKRFVEDLKVRKFAPRTQYYYIQCIEHYAEFFGKPVDELGLEDVRAFLLYLVTEELLMEAHTVEEKPVSTLVLFGGFLAFWSIQLLGQ